NRGPSDYESPALTAELRAHHIIYEVLTIVSETAILVLYPTFASRRKLVLMTTQNVDTKPDKTTKQERNAAISSDGKWRSFPKVPNLVQYISTGTYFERVKIK